MLPFTCIKKYGSIIVDKTDKFITLKNVMESKGVSQDTKNVIDDYFRDLKLANLQPGTVAYNIKIIMFALKNIETDFDKLTPKDAKIFQERLKESHYSESTQKQYIIGFKKFLKWYSKNNDYKNRRKYVLVLEAFVKRKFNVPEKTPSDLLTEKEIMDMIEIGSKNARDKAIIAVLAESGCRVGELVQCRVKDVKFNDKSCNLTFPKGKTGTRNVTLVFATSYLATYLENHHEVKSLNFKESYLFLTERKQPIGTEEKPVSEYKALDADTIRDLVKRIGKRAGITNKRIHPHLFRHTRATQLSKKLKDSQMRDFMGWARNSGMPSFYTHLSSHDMEDAIHEMYGIIDVKKDESGMDIGICKKCKKPVPVGAKICYNCFTPLTLSESEEFKQKIAEAFEAIIYDPERFGELAKDLKKIKDM
jgi:integrase/recombinase XerD